MNRLRSEYADGREKHFEILQERVWGAASEESFAAVGEALGMSEGAVRVAAHRLRRR